MAINKSELMAAIAKLSAAEKAMLLGGAVEKVEVTASTNPGQMREGGSFVGSSGTVCHKDNRTALYGPEVIDVAADFANDLVLIREGGGLDREGNPAKLAYGDVMTRGSKGDRKLIFTAAQSEARCKAIANDERVVRAALELQAALRAHSKA